MTVPTLSKEWVTERFLRLLFQNLVVEERSDVRDATLATWNTALETLSSNYGYLENLVTQQVLLEWYAVLMTPLGVPIDTSTFYHASSAVDADPAAERHPIDKNMLTQDMGLVPVEVVWKARLVSAAALAKVTALWPVEVCIPAFLVTRSLIPHREHHLRTCSALFSSTTLVRRVCYRSSSRRPLLRNGLGCTTRRRHQTHLP